MKTKADLLRQAQNEIDAALAKRARAAQMWQDAEEEITIARIKIRELTGDVQAQQIRE